MRRGGGGITDSGGNLALGSVPIEEEVGEGGRLQRQPHILINSTARWIGLILESRRKGNIRIVNGGRHVCLTCGRGKSHSHCWRGRGSIVKSSQVTFIYIALLTIQIVSKHLTVSSWRIECQ